MTRSDNVLPFMWEAYSLRVVIIQESNSPPFQRSIFLKPYFQWEGLNVKLNKRNSLTSILLHTMWVPDHSFHHPMQTPTNGEGRGVWWASIKEDKSGTQNIQTTYKQHIIKQPAEITLLYKRKWHSDQK